MLPLLLLLIPMLHMMQELIVRLGIHTGRGHGDLIRDRFGVGWAWLSMVGLAVATIGSLVTELIGVAGIGELYGLSRALTLPVGVVALLAVVATGSYRRVERSAIVIGLSNSPFLPLHGRHILILRHWRRIRATCPSAITNSCILRQRLSARFSIRG